jgi:hypothetical protein
MPHVYNLAVEHLLITVLTDPENGTWTAFYVSNPASAREGSSEEEAIGALLLADTSAYMHPPRQKTGGTFLQVGPYRLEYEDETAEVHIYGNNSHFLGGDHEVTFSLEEWRQVHAFLGSIQVSVEQEGAS